MQVNCRGRERELALLDLAIGNGRDGRRVLLLSGPSGQGKSTLSRESAARARARGFRPIFVCGRAGSMSAPFQPFCDALPELRALVESLRDDVGDASTVAAQIVEQLERAASEQPVLLVVDDAQALDESSITVLPHLIGIAERCNLSLLVIEQSDATDVSATYRSCIDSFVAPRSCANVQLGPLADCDIRRLVGDQLELSDADPVTLDIATRAGGNPWFAQELAGSWRCGDVELPLTISAAATSRLSTLSDAGRTLVHAIALCPDGAHASWLRLLELDGAATWEGTMPAIACTGLIRVDGDVLSIAHPLMRQAIASSMSATSRRMAHLEIADLAARATLDDVGIARVRGFHLAGAGRKHESVAEHLTAAARNEQLGRIHEAYADVKHALQVEARTGERAALLGRCAAVAMQIDRPSAEQYWIELGRISVARGDDETYAYALFQQYWTCSDGAARDRLERAASLGVDKVGWSARAASNIASLGGDFVEAERLDRIALAHAQRRGDDLLQVIATHRIGVSLIFLARGAEAVEMLRAAVSLATAKHLHGWAVLAWADLADMLSIDMRADEAVVEAAAMLEYVQEMKLDRSRGLANAARANALLRHGDIEQAHRVASDAEASSRKTWDAQVSPLIALIYAESVIEANSAGAKQAVEDAIAVARAAGNESWGDVLEVLAIRASAVGGDLSEAIERIPRAIAATDEMPARAEALSWFVRAAVLNRDDVALQVARPLRGLLQADVAYVNAAIDELDATFDALDSGACDGLSLVAQRWESGGRVLDAARCRAVAGTIRLRHGDEAGARRELRSVKQALHACGAHGDGDRVAGLLRQVGAGSRAQVSDTSVGSLTKRELEIARLVASGLRNREVAAALCLTDKTIESHLSNIFRKVEVRSRVELGTWMHAHDERPMAPALVGA